MFTWVPHSIAAYWAFFDPATFGAHGKSYYQYAQLGDARRRGRALSADDGTADSKVFMATYDNEKELAAMKTELEGTLNNRLFTSQYDGAEIMVLENVKVVIIRVLQEPGSGGSKKGKLSKGKNAGLSRISMADKGDDFTDWFLSALKSNGRTPKLGSKAEADSEVSIMGQIPGRGGIAKLWESEMDAAARKLDTDAPIPEFNDDLLDKKWDHDVMESREAWQQWANYQRAQVEATKDLSGSNKWYPGWGHKTVVAVIDTGVDYDHPDLASVMWRNPGEIPGNGIDDDGNGITDDVYGVDYTKTCRVNGRNEPCPDGQDDHNHGTHCAGIIAAQANNGGEGLCGVASGQAAVGFQPNPNPCDTDMENPPAAVQIMSCKFLSATGGGATSNAVKCLDYVHSMNADISSNSWGGSMYSSALQNAIERNTAAGQLFVAAAGNSDRDNDGFPAYPCVNQGVASLCVASTEQSGAREAMSYFSSWGSETVDLAAPGSAIWSTTSPEFGSPNIRDWYTAFSGTSMACPNVAGVAALVKSYFGPEATGLDLYEILTDASSLDDVSDLDKFVPGIAGEKPTRTNGRVNANKAMLTARARLADPAPPVATGGACDGELPETPEPPATTPSPPTTQSPPTPTTNSPPGTTTGSPPGDCRDDPDFVDSRGRGCDYYSWRPLCWSADQYRNPDTGLSATDSCVMCGGGIDCGDDTTSNPTTGTPSTTQPPINPTTQTPSTTRPPINPTTQSPSTTQPPINPTTQTPSTTQPPINPTTQTPSTTQPPATTGTPSTQPPSTGTPSTTQPPVPTTQSPPNTTQSPPNTTQSPPNTTQSPPNTTALPPTTTTTTTPEPVECLPREGAPTTTPDQDVLDREIACRINKYLDASYYHVISNETTEADLLAAMDGAPKGKVWIPIRNTVCKALNQFFIGRSCKNWIVKLKGLTTGSGGSQFGNYTARIPNVLVDIEVTVPKKWKNTAGQNKQKAMKSLHSLNYAAIQSAAAFTYTEDLSDEL